MSHRSVLVVIHQKTSTPGLIGQLLVGAGYHLDLRCPAAGDPLPRNLDRHQAVLVLGGPMSANDDRTLPFIQTELQWIEQVIATHTPYLGICLGAQLLARVLGATIAPHPTSYREIGYYPVTPTPAGQTILGPRSLQVYQWHEEGFDLPAGSTLLATGPAFPHQAFRYGSRAYGLQFHPEITADMIAMWTLNGADQLHGPGAQSRSQQLTDHERYGAMVEAWLQSFLPHWLAAETMVTWPGLRQSA